MSGTVGVSGTVAVTQSGAWSLSANQSVNVAQINGVTPLMGNGVTGTGSQRVTIASDNTPFGVILQAETTKVIGTVRNLGNVGNTVDFVGQNAASPGAAWLIGGQFNTAPTTITSGNSSPLQLDAAGNLLVNIKAPATLPVSLTSTTITGTVAATQSGSWTVQQGTPPWLVGGDVASGSADSGNPIKSGGIARTANPTAVTTGQRVAATFDKLGKQVVVGAIRDLKGVQKTSISVNTETTIVTAGAAGVFNDVYVLLCTNKSATGVFVDFKDATAGTTRMTLAVPANDTRGFTVPVDSAMVQAVAANNWTATVSAAVSSIEITALYVANI